MRRLHGNYFPNLARMTASVACRAVLPPIQAAAGAVALIPKTINFANTYS